MLMVNDLLRHNRNVMSELNSAVTDVLQSGWYVLGEQVKEFEHEFASYCQSKHCISLANGTDALELALRALGIGPGDKVLTVANAGAYATTAILATGATPVYVEIDIDTLLISVDDLRRQIDSRSSAVILTHLYGRVGPVNEVLGLAAEFDIPVVEDCAQAHGAELEGRKVGSFGSLGCFSFYPTKNLGALGDGGAITTNDSALAERVLMLRQYGWRNKYEIALSGGRNSRLDELQAAVLRVKLAYLDAWNHRRFEISQLYVEGIRQSLITLPAISKGNFVGHLFVVRSSKRDELREHLKQNGIMSEVHYPIPDYSQPALASTFSGTSLPVTEQACRLVLTLPCFPEMSDTEVRTVVDALNRWRN